jgi:hypothetical protein
MAAVAGLAVACGSRTGLFGSDGDDLVGSSGGGGPGSAIVDGGDLDELPELDATAKPDVDRRDCPDAGATYIYVVSKDNELFSFYPPDLSFKLIGILACPAGDDKPFSMAVDRKGVAYVLFTNGRIYRVSTVTAACIETPYAPNQLGFSDFGMGFVSDNGGPAERLYITANPGRPNLDGPSKGLAQVDVTTFTASFIGAYSPSITRAELTGTGDGRLYAFWPNQIGAGSNVAEIDKTNAHIVARSSLPIGAATVAFAFAFWGGDFWIFTSPGGPSDVNRFRPSDGTTTLMTSHPSAIVGAGVSTCAPRE